MEMLVVENSKQAIEAELNVEYNVSIVQGKGISGKHCQRIVFDLNDTYLSLSQATDMSYDTSI